MFGAVGVVTSMSGETMMDTVVHVKTGMGMRASKSDVDSCPMSDPNCNDANQEAPSLFFGNMEQAFYLIVEALRSLQFVNYISFALSLMFLSLYLRPILFGTKSVTVKRKSQTNELPQE